MNLVQNFDYQSNGDREAEIVAHWLLIGSDFSFHSESFGCDGKITTAFVLRSAAPPREKKGKLIETNWTLEKWRPVWLHTVSSARISATSCARS